MCSNTIRASHSTCVYVFCSGLKIDRKCFLSVLPIKYTLKIVMCLRTTEKDYCVSHVFPSAWNNSTPTGWIFMKLYM